METRVPWNWKSRARVRACALTDARSRRPNGKHGEERDDRLRRIRDNTLDVTISVIAGGLISVTAEHVRSLVADGIHRSFVLGGGEISGIRTRCECSVIPRFVLVSCI